MYVHPTCHVSPSLSSCIAAFPPKIYIPVLMNHHQDTTSKQQRFTHMDQLDPAMMCNSQPPSHKLLTTCTCAERRLPFMPKLTYKCNPFTFLLTNMCCVKPVANHNSDQTITCTNIRCVTMSSASHRSFAAGLMSSCMRICRACIPVCCCSLIPGFGVVDWGRDVGVLREGEWVVLGVPPRDLGPVRKSVGSALTNRIQPFRIEGSTVWGRALLTSVATERAIWSGLEVSMSSLVCKGRGQIVGACLFRGLTVWECARPGL